VSKSILVLNPKIETVNVKRLMIYSLIPILSLYSIWRIQKFWKITLILLPFAIVERVLTSAMTQNTSSEIGSLDLISLVFLGISVIVTVLLVKHYAQKYNEKIMNGEFN